jgi:hypothetical protein
MSPLEIPGTSMTIPHSPKKWKCPDKNCRAPFDNPRERKKGTTITYHCPSCNYQLQDWPKDTPSHQDSGSCQKKTDIDIKAAEKNQETKKPEGAKK